MYDYNYFVGDDDPPSRSSSVQSAMTTTDLVAQHLDTVDASPCIQQSCTARRQAKKIKRRKQCPECDKSYAHASTLTSHRKRYHGLGSITNQTCNICSKVNIGL